jgi:topoisomerase-4 subunit B
MSAAQLRDTTMASATRTLLRVVLPDRSDETGWADGRRTAALVEALMGRKAESRFAFIQENARFVRDLDV